MSTIDGNTTLNISGDSLSGIVPLELSTVASRLEVSHTVEEDPVVTPIVSPKQIEITSKDHLIEPKQKEVNSSTPEDHLSEPPEDEVFTEVDLPTSKDQYTGCPQVEELTKAVSPISEDQFIECPQVEELTKAVPPISEDKLTEYPQVKELAKVVSPTSEECPQAEVPPSKVITPTYEVNLTGPPQGAMMAPPMQRYRVDAGAPLVECYFTDKKQKPEILDKENM